MSKLALVAAACLVLINTIAAQEERPTRIETENLTADQIAIYRAVLRNYMKGSRDQLRLAKTTEPLEQEWRSIVEGCIQGFKPESHEKLIHRLDPSLTSGMNVLIVDPAHQMAEVTSNDPQKLIMGAIDHGDKVSEKQLDATVRKAFENGLFTLSEIVFDREHRNAMVAYSFVCGGLCGSGNTLALRKTRKQWKVVRRCSGWVS